MIEVVKAPPFATVQDQGWRTGRAVGLPAGGAMHPSLLRRANRMVGNPPGHAGLEWALGPGMLRITRAAVLCVARDAEVRVSGTPEPASVFSVEAGAEVEIVPRGRDRFLYVAVAGGIEVPLVMGSRSTYLPGLLGGYEGRRLKPGDLLPVGEAEAPGGRSDDDGTVPDRAGLLRLRVTRGPQWDRFDAAAQEALLAGAYTVSPASDRMGYRLTGPAVRPREAATLPSEAACPGAVQIPDGGEPIVLMPDGPTVGGYPKMMVVVAADLGELAQCQPGRRVGFREIGLDEARRLR